MRFAPIRNLNESSRRKQSGVTLLITILIMSGLVIIALSVAALSIIESRASRAFVYTEPAINAAQTGAEDALWGIKRNTGVTSCDQSPATQSLSGSKYLACKNTSIPSIFTVTKNNSYTFYLYNPTGGGNLDTTLCGTSGTNPQYQYLNFTYATTGALVTSNPDVQVQIQRLDGTSVTSGTLSADNNSLTLPQSGNLLTCPSSDDQRMQVILFNTSATDDVSVSVTGSPYGLPSFPTLDSTGCAGTAINNSPNCSTSNTDIYTRRLQVTVPQ